MKKKAKEFIKEIIKKRGLTYMELSLLMQEHGYPYSENTIRSKVNRGTFSFHFVLEVCDSIDRDILCNHRKK